jgi:hypothetical protein
MIISTMRQTLLRQSFLIRLLTGSLPPTKEEQKIFDDSPVVTCTTQTHRLVWSPWKWGPLVEFK